MSQLDTAWQWSLNYRDESPVNKIKWWREEVGRNPAQIRALAKTLPLPVAPDVAVDAALWQNDLLYF